MFRLTVSAVLVIITISFLAGCGSQNTADQSKEDPAKYLVQSFTKSGLKRATDVSTFVGQDLYEYIDGGAEAYHIYKFVDVSTAYYAAGDAEVIVDIYRFKSPIYAYGMYCSLRPENPHILPLGIEAYEESGKVEAVKGDYIIRLTSFDDYGDTLLPNAAAEIVASVNGSEQRPEAYELFPTECRLMSDKYYPESYLGYQFLDDVYTMDYGDTGSTVTFFLSDDSSGEKFYAWQNYLNENGTVMTDVSNLPFDEDLAKVYDHSYYDKILFGLKNGKMIGVAGYDVKYDSVLTDWLNNLPASK